MTKNKLGARAWLLLAMAAALCGCSTSLQGPVISKPCLVASTSGNLPCPVAPRSMVLAGREQLWAAPIVIREDDDRIPTAWMSSLHLSR